MEVIATAALKASDGFTKPIPVVILVLGYGITFFALSLALKTVPVGTAYAIWAGMGIFLVALVAAVIFKEIPDWPSILGMALIVAGVVVIQVFSKNSSY